MSGWLGDNPVEVAVGGRPGETCCPDQDILAADGPRAGRADESIWFEATNPTDAT